MSDDAPISEAELAALAAEFMSVGFSPPQDSPPQMVQPAPRGSVPGTSSATSLASTAAGVTPFAPPPVTVSSPMMPTMPAPGPIPPQVVPVAPRGEMPTQGALTSLLQSSLSAFSAGLVPTDFAIPSGIIPSGVPAGNTPHPVGHDFHPAGDEADFYFTASNLVLGQPIPHAGDHHEIFDIHGIRADFPILQERVNGRPLIWFDNAATTQKPQAVIDRIAHFYAHENSNIHRAAHELAARATDAYEEARETVRRFIGAAKTEQVIFVRGTTEAINLVAQSWGGKHLQAGDEVVITHLEHHANIVPWQMVCRKTGAILKVAPVDDAGNLLMDGFEELLGPRTRFVSATHLSNALGTVNPVHEIVALGHRYGARVLIDGAQSVPHVPIDVAGCGADFFVFSGHKIFGPTGIGVLYGTEEALAETPPWQGGGNMIADVTLERAIIQGPPNKFEAGTGNIADAVGLGEALRYVERVGVERIASYEHALLDYATPRLAAISGVRIVGTADHKASVLSFVLDGHDPIEIGKALNTEGIAVRAGHHCAQPILRRMGLEATVRPSFAFYNTFEEIDVFLAAVQRIAEGAAPSTLHPPTSRGRMGCAG